MKQSIIVGQAYLVYAVGELGYWTFRIVYERSYKGRKYYLGVKLGVSESDLREHPQAWWFNEDGNTTMTSPYELKFYIGEKSKSKKT